MKRTERLPQRLKVYSAIPLARSLKEEFGADPLAVLVVIRHSVRSVREWNSVLGKARSCGERGRGGKPLGVRGDEVLDDAVAETIPD